jgi:hypothetical protein
MIYVAIFGALLFLNFSNSRTSKGRYYLYLGVLFFLFIFSAFRFEVGCDWPGYLDQFMYPKEVLGDGEINTLSEPLWWLIIHQLRDIDAAYPWLNVVSSAFFFVGIHVLARRQPDPLGFLTVLYPVLIINMPMSGIRQAAAIGMICVALTGFMDKRLLKYLIFIAIATSLHSSAIIFLVFAPFIYSEISIVRLIFAGLLAVPGAISIFNSSAATLAMTRYMSSDIESAGAIFRVSFISISGAFFLWSLRANWRLISTKDYTLVFVGSLAMVSLLAMVPFSTVISDRIGYYFIPIQGVIFSRVPYLKLVKARTYYHFAIYGGLGALLLYWTQMSAIFAQCYIPYQSWIFGMPTFMKY